MECSQVVKDRVDQAIGWINRSDGSFDGIMEGAMMMTMMMMSVRNLCKEGRGGTWT